MADMRPSMRRLWHLLRENRIPKAALLAVPGIGESLHELAYGGELEDLIRRVQAEDAAQQAVILTAIQDLIARHDDETRRERRVPCIAVIGGGNAEHVLHLDGEMRLRQKHSVKSVSHKGGSGVNYTLRLMCYGVPVLPILTVGDDRVGRDIQDELVRAAGAAALSSTFTEFMANSGFFAPGVATQHGTVVVDGWRRTIFGEEFAVDDIASLRQYIEARLAAALELPHAEVTAAMIGHIHADRPGLGDGASTRSAIEVLTRDPNRVVFANFGTSQIALGFDHWADCLPRLSILQLNLEEIRSLFGGNGRRISLVEMIRTLQEKCVTVIITLDRLGAIASYKDGKDGIMLAWPFDFDGIVDTTGAGDAFGAGVMSRLHSKGEFSVGDFRDAVEEGRAWAAYATTKLGGATGCPSREGLRDFYKDIRRAPGYGALKSDDLRNTEAILQILDRAFPWS